ncbi:MAG: nucleotidyltransferase [Lachnospiraceae bacterium]|nr:nucleotidyltransferase [Lachnospiraceae bacterium]
MKVIGIIAEYNPFHNGHAYQIETLKRKVQADYVVIAMSGNFVQRGAAAVMDKFSRAQMALCCGADLVLELPVLYATASGETFARGGVSLLHHTGLVTHLGFGAESHDLDSLQKIAAVLKEEPEPFQNVLQQELKKGFSFPAARFSALKACFKLQRPNSCADLEQVLSAPNNILALEYLKALSYYASPMIPCLLPRQGQSYHDSTPGQTFSSASSIRTSIQEAFFETLESFRYSSSYSKITKSILPTLAASMPQNALSILMDYPHPFLSEQDFSSLLHYQLLTMPAEALASCADCSSDLADRIKKELDHFCSWNSFCLHLKTKNITYTHLSRMFLHILLSITKEDYYLAPEPSYLRVLGFRREAAPLLTALKAHSSLPLVTSPARAMDTLSEPARRLLALDLKSSDLYRIGLTKKGDCSLSNDYQQPVLCL